MDRVGLVDVRGHKVVEAAACPGDELLGRLGARRLQAPDRGCVLLPLGDGEIGPVFLEIGSCWLKTFHCLTDESSLWGVRCTYHSRRIDTFSNVQPLLEEDWLWRWDFSLSMLESRSSSTTSAG
jgi:hypothetical protein